MNKNTQNNKNDKLYNATTKYIIDFDFDVENSLIFKLAAAAAAEKTTENH